METVLLLLLVMATYRPSGVTAAPIGAAGTVDPSKGPHLYRGTPPACYYLC